MKDNFEDIKKAIDESTERPKSLSRKNVVELIKSKGIAPESKQHRVIPIKRLSAVAAALVVLVGAVLAYNAMGGTNSAETTSAGVASTVAASTTVPGSSSAAVTEPEPTETINTVTVGNGVSSMGSYEKIESYFSRLAVKYYSESYDAEKAFDDAVAAPATTVPAAIEGSAAQSNSAQQPYGETNTQVEGVDEADVIKNDGRYLYILTDSVTLSIVDAQSMTVVSKTEIKSGIKDNYLNVLNIYLSGDTLVAVCALTDNANIGAPSMINGLYSCCCYYSSDTVSIIYDVSDRSAPKEIRRFKQDGEQYSSRMVGSVLYSVSVYNVPLSDEKAIKENCVPEVDGERIAADSIFWDEDDISGEEKSSYIVLTAFDTAQPESAVESLSMLGNSQNIYCTTSSLFIADNVYDENETGTKINAFSIDGTKLGYKTSGTVPGTSLNQFSLDEYKGYFRIATTSYNYSTYIDQSNVYVLDGELEIVGRLENLAYDEQIKSVRFMGDTAYVVTFLNTDPLFVIDLSEPTAPKVMGEVKLPGFSAYLHPVGDGLVLGVGYDGDSDSADMNSVKASLFNVSNPAQPVEVDSYVVKYASTSITYDPKAFMYYPEENLVGIPMTVTREDYSTPVQSYMVLKVSSDGLELLNGFVHASGNDVYSSQYFRGTYIGDSIYTVTDRLVKRFSLQSFDCLSTLELVEASQEPVTVYNDSTVVTE